MSDTEKRPMRKCDFCGIVDDHPYFILYNADGSSQQGHHDCHANNGNDEAKRIVEIAGNKQGDHLRSILESGII